MPTIRWMDLGEHPRWPIAAVAAIAVIAGLAVVWPDHAPSSAAGEPSDRPTSQTTTPDADPSESTQTTTTSISPISTSTSLPTPSSVRTASTSSSTSTTIDPARLPTLRAGDRGSGVIELQRMLNTVSGAGVAEDGIYGPATTAAVVAFQRFVGLPATGAADHATRSLLVFLAAGRTATAWPLPTIGDGGPDGCQVAVIGDSLIAGAPALHAARLRELGCASNVDAVSSRSLAEGWQCKVVQANGSRRLVLLPEPQPGNPTCAPSGLELLGMWADANARGDVIVVALGTNDAGLFAEPSWTAHWRRAIRLAGGRPVVFLTTQARPGDSRIAAQAAYSAALRRWCATERTCVLGDWAVSPAANDPASYVDSVHLTVAATDARARFVRDVVGALITGRPIPNPAPLPTTPGTGPGTTTTTTPTTTTTTTTTTSTVPRATTSTSMPRSTTSTTSSSSTSTSTSTTSPR